MFLLGAVLERFFAKYVSINSFTETVLRTLQRGEVMRWPASRRGQRHDPLALLPRAGRPSRTAFDFFQALAPPRVRATASAPRLGPLAAPGRRAGAPRPGAGAGVRAGRAQLVHARARTAARRACGVRFFGAFGPNGPLPLHLTEYAHQRQRNHARPDVRALRRRLPPPHAERCSTGPGPTRGRRSAHDRPEADRFVDVRRRAARHRHAGAARARRVARQHEALLRRPLGGADAQRRGAARDDRRLLPDAGRDRGVRRRVAERGRPALLAARRRPRRRTRAMGVLGQSALLGAQRLGAPAQVPRRARAAAPRSVRHACCRAAAACASCPRWCATTSATSFAGTCGSCSSARPSRRSSSARSASSAAPVASCAA